jgi:FMN phosphatase YigB (HAD superfamily)
MEKSLPECIVFDFDGTFTNVDEEAETFLAGYQADLSSAVGRDLDPAWTEARALIVTDPGRFGWEHGGHIVAPANADPFIMTSTVARTALDRLGLLTMAADRDPLLATIFEENYAKAAPAFRSDARDVLETVLRSGVPTFVVTNSVTSHVNERLDRLSLTQRNALTVFGNARKYALVDPQPSDPRFSGLPASEAIPRLARPVMLRRGHYFEALREAWNRTRVPPERTLVCGDIFELDLAMPRRLGTRVHLVCRPSTPGYERETVVSTQAGSASERLSDVLEHVGLA